MTAAHPRGALGIRLRLLFNGSSASRSPSPDRNALAVTISQPLPVHPLMRGGQNHIRHQPGPVGPELHWLAANPRHIVFNAIV